jgi:hypothetical protein
MIDYIDTRIAELRDKYKQDGNSEWHIRINELRRIREHLLVTTEKDNPCYLRNPSGLHIAITSQP